MTNAIEELKAALRNYAGHLPEQVVKRNGLIKSAGIADTNLYFIQEGSVRVFVTDDELHEHTLYFGYNGSLISALDSFLTGKNSVFCIQALKKTCFSRVSKSTCLAFQAENEGNRQLWQRALEAVICQQVEREIHLAIASPAKRYQKALENRPDLFQEIPEKYIASYLRMSAETLSRLKKLDAGQVFS